MSVREYFTCKNCGFSYMEVNYYFRVRENTSFVEMYESLFSTMNYADESPVNGRVLQRYCKNCDKTIYIYQTYPGNSIYTRESTIDFLKEGLAKKHTQVLKTTAIFKKLVDMVKSNAKLMELNDLLKEHEDDICYKIDFNDYLSEKSFKGMDFNIGNYTGKKADGKFDKENLEDLDLKSIFKDMSNHLKGISANDLNLDEFNSDMSLHIYDLNEELKRLEGGIICINYYDDDFIITLDGDEIDGRTCPECKEEFYLINPNNPCPKCEKKEIEYECIHFD